VVDVSASATLRADREVVDELLARDVPGVLGGRPGPGGRRTSVVELPISLRGGAHLLQEVEVRIGAPDRAAEVTRWPVGWRPVANRALAPSFSGCLEVVRGRWETTLRLSGSYAPPLGVLGAVGDRLLRERAAVGLRELVADLGRRIDASADARIRRTGHARPPEVREAHPLHPRG
jgi:hypothetical protein